MIGGFLHCANVVIDTGTRNSLLQLNPVEGGNDGRELAAVPEWAGIKSLFDAGDVAVIDHHRVLHGRTGFELGAEGRRELIGCYVDREDVTSTLAVLDRSG